MHVSHQLYSQRPTSTHIQETWVGDTHTDRQTGRQAEDYWSHGCHLLPCVSSLGYVSVDVHIREQLVEYRPG